MFIHNFKYSLKTLVGNKMLLFWTFAFPIIMALLFDLAFSKIEKNEALSIIEIAVVNNQAFDSESVLAKTIEQLSDKDNEDQLFNTTYVSEDEAKELLNEEKIDGFIVVKDNKPQVFISENGINQTVIKSVVDEIMQTEKMVNSIIGEKVAESQNTKPIDINKLSQEIISAANNSNADIKDISPNKLSYTMIEYYTLIAMCCLYCAMLGMVAINNVLPNMGAMGKRVSISPVSKLKMVLSSVSAAFVAQVVGLAILYIFTIFVVNVDYGEHLGHMVLLSLLGSFAGIAMGVAVGATFKIGENGKVGVIMIISMTGCFLSGMMGITMKYIIDTYAPILNKVNPAAMITDGLYTLYYYGVNSRFYMNVISLAILSAVLIFISFLGLRRQRYDSI